LSISILASEFVDIGSPVINDEKINRLKLNNIRFNLQDKDGFIWLAGEEGLLRFDGNNFKPLPGLGDLSHPIIITALVEGSSDHIWIGTKNSGLLLFERESSKLTIYSEEHNQKIKLKDNQVNVLFFKNNNLYVGNKNVIHIVDEKTLELKKRVSLDEKDVINSLLVDSKGGIWCSAIYKNLYYFIDNELVRFLHTPSDKTTISSNFINTIFEDSQKRIWIGSFSGLDLFLPSSHTFAHYTPFDNTIEPYKSIAGSWVNGINDIIADRKGNLWLSMLNSGLVKFSPLLETFEAFETVKGINTTLLTNRTYGLLLDKQKTLWVFTPKGISRIYNNIKQVKQWANIDNDSCRPKLIDEQQSDLFFACNNKLYQINDDYRIIKLHQFDQLISGIVHDKNNGLWIGTSGGGIYQYDIETRKIKHYGFNGKINGILAANTIRKIVLDVNDVLYGWLARDPATIYSGIVRYDASKDIFLNFSVGFELDEFIDINTDKMLFFEEFENESLNWYDKKTKHIEHLDISTGKIIDAIKWKQHVWISSAKMGLFLLDIKTNQITVLDNNISPITSFHLSNKNEVLYATTKNDIYKLSRITDNNLISLCLSCSMSLGQTSQLNSANTYLSGDNSFFIGTKNKLIRINLDAIQPQPFLDKLILTDLKVMNQSIFPTTSNVNSLLTKSIEYTNKIVMPYDNTSFTLSFSRANYIKPEKIEYAYKMEGLYNEWLHTNAGRREATYTSLPEGNYMFKVKSTDYSGRWMKQGLSLAITVLPPWWRAWWAYSLYILIISGISLILFWSFYQRKIAEKAHRSAVELAAVKEHLFANLSHEFRTPLTLILGPASAIKKGNDTKKNLFLIERNARHLLSMVDQLLDLARLRSDQSNPSESLKVDKICHFVLQTFHSLRIEKNIKLYLVAPIDDFLWVSGTKGSLETILFNLISNSFKYTPVGGEIALQVNSKSQWVFFKLSDTGCGIAQKDQSRIFERFTRLKNAQNYAPGTGIGLALVKELVESFGGQISVNSKTDEGSTFMFSLPKTEKPKTTSSHIPLPNSNLYFDHVIENLELSAKLGADKPNRSRVTPDEIKTFENTTGKPRILIVEDNSEMLAFIKQILIDLYIVLESSDGAEGLSVACCEIPDLIVSDIMMPEMDGFDFIKSIRKEQKTSHIPVILLTARGDQVSRLQGLSNLADDYMTKPFDVDELLQRISSLLSIRSLLQQRFSEQLVQIEPVTEIAPVKTENNWLILEQYFITKFNEVLKTQCADPELKVADMATALHMTERQLFRKLRAIMNITPAQYLRNYRLQKAATMILKHQAITEIAYETGFSSPTNFSRCFRAKYGCSPSQYIGPTIDNEHPTTS